MTLARDYDQEKPQKKGLFDTNKAENQIPEFQSFLAI